MTPLPLWTASASCRNGGHCAACRDPGPAGERFRASLARRYDVPAECPYGQPIGVARGVKPRVGGAGTELARVLKWWGIAPRSACRCRERAAEMDARGVAWCAANVDAVVGWLREESARRGWPFLALAARGAVWWAIHRARAAHAE